MLDAVAEVVGAAQDGEVEFLGDLADGEVFQRGVVGDRSQQAGAHGRRPASAVSRTLSYLSVMTLLKITPRTSTLWSRNSDKTQSRPRRGAGRCRRR